MLIASVFDISERLDDFVRTKPSFWVILTGYYQNFVYFYANVFSFLIVFIAVIFFTSKLAQNSEVIAMLSSGVSFNRFLRPYFIAATILAGISLYSNHFVLPHANKKFIQFHEKYIWNRSSSSNVHREMEPGVIAYFYSNAYGYMENFWLEKWDDQKLVSVMYADSAGADSVTNRWRLRNYFIRYVGNDKENDKIIKGIRLDTALHFKPGDFGKRSEYASSMTSAELRSYIRSEKDKGNEDVESFEIELHQRTAYPVSTYMLTLIAVCVACRKTRGGRGVHLAIGLIVAVCYIFCMKVASVAATNVGLNTALAVWLPNILFFGIAVLFYRWARR
jgi:lipopolysaccharide export system permease protein